MTGDLESGSSLQSSLGVWKPVTVTYEILGAAAEAGSEYMVNGHQQCQCCTCLSRLLAVFSAQMQPVTNWYHEAVYY